MRACTQASHSASRARVRTEETAFSGQFVPGAGTRVWRNLIKTRRVSLAHPGPKIAPRTRPVRGSDQVERSDQSTATAHVTEQARDRTGSGFWSREQNHVARIGHGQQAGVRTHTDKDTHTDTHRHTHTDAVTHTDTHTHTH
eukprot:2343023-Rhodomonas_salina.1